ncbi:Alpha/Beta hydrolase protein [Echria macrotheca]|uniref:Feruloyl esterase C n=1 Tax=Echria macrotheca TaxID=438768 RepID=A0AAJ0BGB1_9PEZI|nr:Alpha/Beta hydrolase protein [Echria macrotheca]
MASLQSLRWLFGLLAALCLLAPVLAEANVTAGCGKTPTLTSGQRTLTVNGKSRQWIIRLPSNYDKSKPHRLIFGLHWRDADFKSVDTGSAPYYGLRALAGDSTIFIAPNGLNKGWANSGGEDVTLIDTILQTVSEDLCIDQNLIFSVGFSYGAAMSYSLACSRPKVFRAVAVLSGALLSGCSGGTEPVAYYCQHGVRDSVLNISNGKQLRDNMLKRNGCQAKTAQEPARNSKTHIKTEYSCNPGYPVTFVAFDEDHVALPKDSGGDGGANSWTIPEVWKFFSQFT